MTPARQRARIVELLGDSLLASPWLSRLGRISFLGTLDQHPRSRRSSNRLEHSLGVASLAADAAVDLGLPRERAQLFVAACLLHDIGHYPLSHAAEPAFAKLLGAGHHEVGRWIVLGT
ncbi:MAG TPA: HD domain-containing protein, partial [Enhygromyxa sp.]|nr:HD domain-containing protein [Enhygromyxa sp.]